METHDYPCEKKGALWVIRLELWVVRAVEGVNQQYGEGDTSEETRRKIELVAIPTAQTWQRATTLVLRRISTVLRRLIGIDRHPYQHAHYRPHALHAYRYYQDEWK